MKTAIIGAGAMGGALAAGLMKSETISPSDLTISDPSEKALARFSQSGASITTDNLSAIEGATTLFIVVKPWLGQQVIEGILPAINGKRLTIVVIAAGIHATDLCQWLRCDDNKDFNVFLAIPNTAIAVGESMTFLVPVKATAETTNQISELFGHHLSLLRHRLCHALCARLRGRRSGNRLQGH